MVDLNRIRDWDTAKILILRRWDKLKPRELENTSANFDEVAKLIQKHYDEPKPNIESELKNLIDQIDR